MKDCDGNEGGPIDVSYKHFVENARWKQTLIPTAGLGDLNVWFSSWTRWSYHGKINDFDKYENDRFTERMRASMGMSDVREFRPTDFEAIDKHLAEKEAIERSKRGLLVYEEVTREEASSSDRCSKEQIADLTEFLAKRRKKAPDGQSIVGSYNVRQPQSFSEKRLGINE